MARVFVIGMPRSGTTWLGKLLDAHPRVLYRHEPDNMVDTPVFPFLVPRNEWDQYQSRAAEHFARLADNRALRTMSVQPHFRKDFRNPLSEWLRRGLMLVVRGAEVLPYLRNIAPTLSIPDLARNGADMTVVVKSVIAPGRAGLYAAACPDVAFIIILRHPCGYVASQLRGHRLGALAGGIPIKAMAKTEQARVRDLSMDALNAMDFVEQATWLWLIFNEKMLQEITGRPNCLVVRYEDLCTDTPKTLQRIYDFSKLDYGAATEAFLHASSRADAKPTGYYSLFRDPEKAANRWRTELEPDMIERIERIAADSVPGRYYL